MSSPGILFQHLIDLSREMGVGWGVFLLIAVCSFTWCRSSFVSFLTSPFLLSYPADATPFPRLMCNNCVSELSLEMSQTVSNLPKTVGKRSIGSRASDRLEAVANTAEKVF